MISFETASIAFSEINKNHLFNDGKLDGKVFVSERDAIDKCVETLKSFHEIKSPKYIEGNIDNRSEMLHALHESFCDSLGTNSTLRFEPMDNNYMGVHDPDTNTVTLNESLLEDSNPREVIMTDLHEIRHDFQNKAVKMPLSIDIDDAIINIWKENFDNYISPEFDFEAYSKQPVEVDANDFATTVFDNAINR